MKKNELVASPENRNRLLVSLSNHIGEMNAISMSALYEEVFQRPWQDRVNDTRPLRKLITIMRDEGVPICSVSISKVCSGGYYHPAAGSEDADYLLRLKNKALRELRRYAKIKKITLPNFLGQLRLEEEGNIDGKSA